MAATPIADLLQLPMAERMAMAMALWDSLDDEGRSDALPLDVELCAELDRRWMTFSKPVSGMPDEKPIWG